MELEMEEVEGKIRSSEASECKRRRRRSFSIISAPRAPCLCCLRAERVLLSAGALSAASVWILCAFGAFAAHIAHDGDGVREEKD